MRSGSAPDAAPWIALVALGIVAAVLALIGLGDLPLRDFDEATVAQVALELRHGLGEAPLLPTLWDKPYLNKAPGLHSLIALVIGATTQPDQLPSEWTIRLAPALLSCLVVPLGGWLQWTLRPGDRSSALATSVILLTLLPVARHGRLAMLDGTQLSAMALLWLALMKLNGSRTSALWGGVAGLMASAMLLLKAPLLVPAAVAAVVALAWSQEWKSWPNKSAALIGMLLGLAPGIGWHLWHAHIRGSEALWLWGGDGAGRVLLDAGEGSDLGWRVPLIEVLEGGWPWLPLLPFALAWAWRWRQSRWGRWSLASLLTLAGAILPLRTQLPWYSHPLWLPIALLCAPLLAWLVEQPLSSKRAPESPNPPCRWLLSRLPMFWCGLGLLLLLLWLSSFTSIGSSLVPYRDLAVVLGLGWCGGGWWLRSGAPQRRRLGVISLSCGNVAALALLFHSPLWLWELNETWPVQPVAALARANPGGEIRLKGYDERPSLNWYAEQRIQRYEGGAGLRLSDKPQENCVTEGQAGRWTLANCR
ncbi:glycosyltransferase family 39 protein [Synechococcus sp. A15-44]|uniref:ArnT family glycosyltransferase n=1 Tax=Synechococcus sp. A15-44 TaxID=1050646 RepID=UPI001649061D|nr:4-amino-4-deoxy-L-arabinose transferase [Synechococcus sp. A15-44]QNI65822.1 inverting glycosyltransferase family 83 utilizing lipid monophospho-sugar donors [Synechococcus sp. A15-44]